MATATKKQEAEAAAKEAANGVGGRFSIRMEEIQAEWWDDDEKVVVKERTFYEDQQLAMMSFGGGAARIQLSKIQTEQQREQFFSEAEVDMAHMALVTLLKSIESWTLKGPDGKVMPLNEKSLKLLAGRDGNFIQEASRRLNPDRDEDFQGGRGDGVPEREGAAAGGA